METIIYDVTCEFSKNPINVFTKKPRFAWKIKSYSGFKQRSYRIGISSSINKVNDSIFDLWDSGEIISDISNNIEYNGEELKSKDQGYYKIFVTDTNGNTFESDINSFELTLLSKNDFTGRFMSMPARDSGEAQYIRYDFNLEDKKVARGRVYMCGLGYSELYCNGEKVDDRELSPAFTDYQKRISFVTYDITKFLKKGGNALGIILGYGWYGNRKVKADLYVEYEDGKTFSDSTRHSLTWLVNNGPIKSNSIYGGESYDARFEEKQNGWNQNGYYSYYDNGWGFCVNCDEPSGELVSEIIEPIKVISRHNAELIYSENNRFLYDAKKNIAGFAEIVVSGKPGTIFTLKYGERIDSTKTKLETGNLRTARACDTYICKGEGKETYRPRFTYHGFEYIEITIDGEGQIFNVDALFVGASVKKISHFDSSSKILNKLHENVLITEQGNLHSIMTDCPQRDERFGWLNDLSPRTFEQLNNFDLEKYYDKVLDDISDTVVNGMIADTAPYYIGNQPADPTSAYLLLALRNYQRYGNIRVLEKHYDKMKGWVDFLYNKSDAGILNWCLYGDWVEPYANSDDPSAKTPKNFVATNFLYWQIKLIKQISTILKKADDEIYYQKLLEVEKEIINNEFFDEKNICYSTNSQTANALPLSLGIAKDEYKAELAKKINDDIVKRNYHYTSGNQGYRHVCAVLTEFGYQDTLYKALVNPEYPGWGYAISQGACSIWERWEAAVEVDMVSFNHPMYAAIDSWLLNCLVGIDVDEDSVASNKITIKPTIVKDLEYVTGSIELMNGQITSSWKRNGEFVDISIDIPPYTNATIKVPGIVVESNVKAEKCNTYNVLSGNYTFKVKYE